MFKLFGKLIGFLFMLVVIAVGALFVLGSVGPSTSIYTGTQLPAKFVTKVQSLQLINEGEPIQYFYSDGIFSIEEGLYFLTDSRLALYCKDWVEPKIILPFARIESVSAEFNDSFFEDSVVHVTSKEGAELYFPLSSENGLDKKFVQALEAGVEKAANSLDGIFGDPGGILDIVIDETVDRIKKGGRTDNP